MNKKNAFFIADDDPDDQEIFVNALKEIDEFCECIIASDGKEAIEKLLSLQSPMPDFIFLDLNMPRVNGKQALQEIKKIPQLKDIPVIIYSTTADKKEMQEAIDLGAAIFLQKPNRFDDLCKFLEKIIKLGGH